MGAYILRVPIYLWGAFIRDIASASPIAYQRHMCGTSCLLYTTGMTVALMGFVLEPLDCLLQCYESVNTAGKKQSNCCEESSAPGQDLRVVSVNNFHEFNCITVAVLHALCIRALQLLEASSCNFSW